MNKIKTISVLMVLMVSLLALGCGGGGGASSVPIEKDVVGITRTLNDFLAAARSNDQAKLQSLLAAPVEYYLKVKDFGPDITNPDDNQSYEFYVNSDLINQTSSNEAHVYAYYMLHSGQPYWLYFKLMREDGRWIIEEMANKAPQSGGYVEPIVPVTPPPPPVVPSNEFVVASYNPLDNSIEKVFSVEDNAGTVASTRVYTRYGSAISQTSPENSAVNITFYELTDMDLEPDSAEPYDGYGPSATSRRSLARNLASSIVGSVKRNLRSSRFSLRAQTQPDIYVYYGLDSEGAFWIKLEDPDSLITFNNGVPIKLFEKSHSFGASRVVTYPYEGDGFSFTVTISISIGSPITGFKTPLQAYTVVPVTFSLIDSEFDEGEKWVEYHALGIGEVGVDYYEAPVSSVPYEKDRLLTRYKSDGSLNQRNDPVITNSSTYLGSYIAGQDITTTQVTASGGTGPLSFRWHVSVSGPEMLLEGIRLTTDGIISGYIAGNPPAGTGMSGNVEVVDKYHRATYKPFTVDIETSTLGVVAFSPAMRPITAGNTLTSYLMLEGTSVQKDTHSFTLLDVAPAAAEGYITITEDVSGYAIIEVQGYQAGVTINFKVRAINNLSNAILISDLQSVPVSLAVSLRK